MTTYYVGNYLEWRGNTTTMTRYYYADGQRIAMRQGSSTVYFLLGDHLGSTSVTATSTGAKYAEQRYYPWGGTRWPDNPLTPTARRYTGQIEDAAIGLYFYNARYYDPALGRFLQADTIVPDHRNPQLLNRYSYAGNNPIRYNDPDGHCGPLCWAGIALGLSGVALTVNASQPLPPERQPSDTQGFVGMGLIFAGLGLQAPGLLISSACGDGNCTNEVEQGVNALCGGDCSDELRTNEQVLKEGLAYRGGSATPGNLTPRPGMDPGGLSTFNNLKSAAGPGNKAQVIDISRLPTPLQAVFDNSPPGHISIRPSDLSLIPEWAATRGTDFMHPFTQGVMDAIIGVERVPK